jgi:hypothetical protein
MAITQKDTDIQTSSGVSSVTSKTLSWVSGDLIVVHVLFDDNGNGNPTLPTTTGANLTFADCGEGLVEQITVEAAQTYIGTPSGAGSGTITAGFDESVDGVSVHFEVWEGDNPLDVDSTGSYAARTPTPSYTITTTEDNTTVSVGWAVIAENISVGSGWVESQSADTGSDTHATSGYKLFTSSGGQTVDGSLFSNRHLASIAVALFEEAGSGGGEEETRYPLVQIIMAYNHFRGGVVR